MHLGLDFGTTNSAIARAGADGEVRLASYAARLSSARTQTFRTILYFDPQHLVGGRPEVLAGPSAIERYLAGDGSGRLIQSVKSHLASRLFERTMIFGRTFTLPDLVALFVERLFREAEQELGALDRRRIVVGRPVRYASAERPEDDDLAVARMREGLAMVGIEDPIFQPEPLAAAHAYARSLDHQEIVLVADFGGGTSDFCVMSLGGAESRVLATDGVGVAGDAFDGEVVMRVVAPALGFGSRYRARMGNAGDTLEVPPWIFGKLRRWHHLSMLKSKETLELIEDLRLQALEPEKLVALKHVVEADLGFHLYRAVEGTKVALTRASRTELSFDDEPAVIRATVDRERFEQWIVDPLSAIGEALDRTLRRAGLHAHDVDAVFMTGGSSLVPAVRARFADRFGEHKLRGGEELVSVALGLALSARDLS